MSIEFTLGYLEEAARYTDRPFDLVFNRDVGTIVSMTNILPVKFIDWFNQGICLHHDKYGRIL